MPMLTRTAAVAAAFALFAGLPGCTRLNDEKTTILEPTLNYEIEVPVVKSERKIKIEFSTNDVPITCWLVISQNSRTEALPDELNKMAVAKSENKSSDTLEYTVPPKDILRAVFRSEKKAELKVKVSG